MHADPPVYHRDIRAPNIIRRFDGNGWFLIDWGDASALPTSAVRDFKGHEHSPRVIHDNHGPEVDLWGIANYMETIADCVTCGIAQTIPVKEMARRWKGDPSTTATSALEEIEVRVFH